MAVQFGGLISGLDTGSLIDSLVAAERSSANLLSQRQSQLSTKKSIVSSMSSAVAAFGTAVRALDLDSEIKPQGVTVTDSKVSVAVSSAASSGAFDLRVSSLAAARVMQSQAFAGNGAGVAGTGGLDITVAGTTKSIAWDSTDSLESIASKINNANAGVSASVLKVDDTNYKLVVTGKSTGTAASPTFVNTGSSLGLAQVTAASDAELTINGIAIKRPTNTIADAMPGMTLTLNGKHEAADPTTRATVALDTKALTEKVKAVVTAYNSINSALHVQLDYTGTTKGQDTLFGDSTLRQLRTALDATIANAYGSSSLSALGINRDKTGAMTLDESKLTAAVGADPDAVSKIFVSGGFAAAASALADQYTKAGGLFAAKTDSLTATHKALQQQIDRINTSADATKARLEKQFGALESAMSQLQSQGSYLASILSR
jgi:flagellar hook-associated protein 2